MTILTFGTSITDFFTSEPTKPVATETNISPYAQEGLLWVDGGSRAYLSWTGQTDVWIAWYQYCNRPGDMNTNYVTFYGENDEELFRINRIDNSSAVNLEAYDGTTWNILFTTGELNRGRWDIHLVMDNSAGVVEFFEGGISQGRFDGDTVLRSASQVAKAGWAGSGEPSGFFDVSTTVSAVFVADADTRSTYYVQTKPSSVGNWSEWSGDHTAIDETGFGDLDAIRTQGPGLTSTFGQGSITSDFDNGYFVSAVGVSARANKGTTGSPNMQFVIRSGSTDDVSSTVALDIGKQSFNAVFANDPNTGTTWTVTNAKNAEIGVKSINS